MSLAIDRLHTRFRSPLPLPRERRDEWLAAFAEVDGDALSAGLVGSDEWLFIARLPLALRWSLDSAPTAVGEQWQTQLRHAIEQALAAGDDGHAGHDGHPSLIIRYASRREALADLLYRSALGERSRQWAWQRMGLIARAASSADEVLSAGVALLVDEPPHVWPVLQRLLVGESRTAALTALLRALPTAAWPRLFAASPRTAAYVSAQASIAHGTEATATDVGAQHAAPLQASREVCELLRWASTRAHFAARHLDTLTVLLAALRWSAAGAPVPALHARLAAVRAELAAAITASGARTLARSATPPATEPGGSEPATAVVAQTSEVMTGVDALPDLPALPESTDWQCTAWGGALFWLGRLPASGALAWLGERPGLPADALPLLLRALAEALAVPADDAAQRAFCGGEVATGEMPAAVEEYAARLADNWAAWLAEQAPEVATPRLQSVCRRRGRIRFEPGWIELVLPLDSVDTSTRRLGLDLDPGWLPWLACVLRIRYER